MGTEMIMNPTAQQTIEEKAASGDGAFAIAYALLQLADAQNKTASALDRLGLNYEKSDGSPGAVEMIGMQMRDIVSAIENLASNLSHADE